MQAKEEVQAIAVVKKKNEMRTLTVFLPLSSMFRVRNTLIFCFK